MSHRVSGRWAFPGAPPDPTGPAGGWHVGRTLLRSMTRCPLQLALLSALSLAACGAPSEAPPDAALEDAALEDAEVSDAGAPEPRDAAIELDAGPAPCGAPGDGALLFDGVDDHVAMGPAPALGLATFTLEAWIHREGRGAESGTGAGGVRLVPVIAKGRGERDGSELDCNYAFGLHGDVLAADFEDLESGANHPVLGQTAVPVGEWHHVAVTYDGAAWRLFLDGRLDRRLQVDATPRADSVQHFGLGATFDSEGTPRGAFAGRMDEVRVWSRARSGAELRETLHRRVEAADGLVARWALDGGDAAPDAVGETHGAVVGAVPAPGVSLDRGAPPALTLEAPAGRTLTVGVETEAPVDVEVFARQITEDDDFTVVVLPDTQNYTIERRNLERFFHAQTRWVVDNRDRYDIVGVIHNGDIVGDARVAYQWRVADRALGRLERPLPRFADGVPYGLSVGNHDQWPRRSPGDTTEFNRHFGVARFADRFWYGGHYGSTNDQSWVTFQADGMEILVVNLEFDESQDPAVVAWARQVFQAHPDAFGILNSHYLVNGRADLTPQGRAIYRGLRDLPNVHLMTSGHITAERRRVDRFEGHAIHSMVADYQGRDQGGAGYMRLWEFSPANDEITVRTYSPELDRWETDANSEFTIPMDLSSRRVGSARFASVGRVEGATGAVSVTLDGARAGTLWEWYAEAASCDHEARSSLGRFRVER